MGYSPSSLNGHLYKIGTSINRTFRDGHFFLCSFKSTLEKDGRLSKTDTWCQSKKSVHLTEKVDYIPLKDDHVVVQFYPGLNFISLCFWVWQCMMSLKRRKIKFKPRITLNCNSYLKENMKFTFELRDKRF